MEQKFIKYKAGQINLARLYRVSNGDTFDINDVKDGTLVIGHWSAGQYLVMGYLRGITRDANTGEIYYEITNAIEGDYNVAIQAPVRANVCELPFFAATGQDFTHPAVGRIYKCNGELAVMDTGCGKVTVNVNSVLELVQYFKENDQ